MEAAGIAHISRIIVQVDRFGGLIWRCHQDLLAHCGRSLGDALGLAVGHTDTGVDRPSLVVVT